MKNLNPINSPAAGINLAAVSFMLEKSMGLKSNLVGGEKELAAGQMWFHTKNSKNLAVARIATPDPTYIYF